MSYQADRLIKCKLSEVFKITSVPSNQHGSLSHMVGNRNEFSFPKIVVSVLWKRFTIHRQNKQNPQTNNNENPSPLLEKKLLEVVLCHSVVSNSL